MTMKHIEDTPTTPVVIDDASLTEPELKQVAWYLDVLLEIDMTIKYKQVIQSW